MTGSRCFFIGKKRICERTATAYLEKQIRSGNDYLIFRTAKQLTLVAGTQEPEERNITSSYSGKISEIFPS